MEYHTGIVCAMQDPCFSLLESPLNKLLPSPLPSSLRKEGVEREPNKLGLKHPRLAYGKTSLEKVRAILKLMYAGMQCSHWEELTTVSTQRLDAIYHEHPWCMHAVLLGLLNELRYDLVICMALMGRDWWISSGHTCASPRLGDRHLHSTPTYHCRSECNIIDMLWEVLNDL